MAPRPSSSSGCRCFRDSAEHAGPSAGCADARCGHRCRSPRCRLYAEPLSCTHRRRPLMCFHGCSPSRRGSPVAASSVAERVILREQDVSTLDEHATLCPTRLRPPRSAGVGSACRCTACRWRGPRPGRLGHGGPRQVHQRARRGRTHPLQDIAYGGDLHWLTIRPMQPLPCGTLGLSDVASEVRHPLAPRLSPSYAARPKPPTWQGRSFQLNRGQCTMIDSAQWRIGNR